MKQINKLALIGAMKEEVEMIISQMDHVTESTKAGILYREGTFRNKQVVVCMTGVGKVNAAVCTQQLIETFGVDAVLFTGVAGALDPALEIGDIVVSTECMQHDMDVTPLGFKRGIIPYQENSIFAADADLVKLAKASCDKLFSGRAVLGRVLSGDQFIASPDVVRMLRQDLEGACVEMEGSAVAQVCAMHQIPYVVIRSMSDKADGSADVSYAEFTKLAAQNSYSIVEDMVQAI
ncbi:5'-methylthioadenosine/adenosylhomocysteine nucleosidase [Paenibacillus albiflavus]|nr:5'-methylthioadenosine/adenosylhomocysteine nucleosidase [Paenibacillus albiflavus]